MNSWGHPGWYMVSSTLSTPIILYEIYAQSESVLCGELSASMYFYLESLVLMDKKLWCKIEDQGWCMYSTIVSLCIPILVVEAAIAEDTGMTFTSSLHYYWTKESKKVYTTSLATPENYKGKMMGNIIYTVEDYCVNADEFWAYVILIEKEVVLEWKEDMVGSYVAGWVLLNAEECIRMDGPNDLIDVSYRNINDVDNKRRGALPIRSTPSLASPKVDYIPRFTVVEATERRIEKGQLWIRARYKEGGDAWLIARNATTGVQVLEAIKQPGESTVFYRNVYATKALPVRSSPWLSAETRGRLSVGCVFRSDKRILNDLGEIWIQVQHGSIHGWVITNNAKSNAVIVMEITPPFTSSIPVQSTSLVQMDQYQVYNVIFHQKPLQLYTEPNFQSSIVVNMALVSGDAFLCPCRQLMPDGAIWLQVMLAVEKQVEPIGWIPECFDGLSPVVALMPRISTFMFPTALDNPVMGILVRHVTDPIEEIQVSRQASAVLGRGKRFFSFDTTESFEEERILEAHSLHSESHSMEEILPVTISPPGRHKIHATTIHDSIKVEVDPPEGVYHAKLLEVYLSCPIGGVKIYYTIDGTSPDLNSLTSAPGQPIVLETGTSDSITITIKAIAVIRNRYSEEQSQVIVRQYTLHDSTNWCTLLAEKSQYVSIRLRECFQNRSGRRLSAYKPVDSQDQIA